MKEINKSGGKWPREVKERVWAMRCDGVMPKEITRLLNVGDAGLPAPCPVTYPTVVEWVETFKRDRGLPEHNIAPGTAEKVIDSLERKAISFAKERMESEIEKKADADTSEINRCLTILRTARKSIREGQADPDPDKQRAGRENPGPSRDILKDIAANEAKRREPSDEPAPDEPSTDAPLPPDTPALAIVPPRVQESQPAPPIDAPF